MQLSQWNRFRHDTFKERPDDEMPFILGTGTSSVLAAELDSGGATAKPVQSCQIKQVFTFVSQGVHVQKDKKEIPCFYWTCTQKNCKLQGKPIKEMRKGTGLLFRHLKTCNEARWRQLRLSSKHSKALQDDEGEERQMRLPISSFRWHTVCSTTRALRTTLCSRVCCTPVTRSPASCRSKMAWASAWDSKWRRC